ncbi:MAG TPA: EamA family transporter [Rhodanobacteraceae bacterium]|nr:EamA family transporter [Rhodanobacteraceae bacterium]
MMMFALLLCSVACDVVGQVCFKLGVGDDANPAGGGIAGFLRGIVRSRWIALGVVVYALEFVVWYAALTIAPLSLAMPFAALSYCGIVVASRLILREHISPRRWAATLIVAAGVAIVCLPTT